MNDYSYHTVSSIINAFKKKCEEKLRDWVIKYASINFTNRRNKNALLKQANSKNLCPPTLFVYMNYHGTTSSKNRKQK